MDFNDEAKGILRKEVHAGLFDPNSMREAIETALRKAYVSGQEDMQDKAVLEARFHVHAICDENVNPTDAVRLSAQSITNRIRIIIYSIPFVFLIGLALWLFERL